MEGKTGIARQGGQSRFFLASPLCVFAFSPCPIQQPKSKIQNSKFKIQNQLTDDDYSGKLEIVETMRV
jgi:hypothetical protein